MHRVRDAASLKILAADDNQELLELLAVLLRSKGYSIEVAADGLAAVKLASSFKPDVVSLDIEMPHLNGYEAARQIRQHLGPNVVLIALTSYGRARDKQAAAEAGFDHHFTKPPNVPALIDLLAQLAARKSRHD